MATTPKLLASLRSISGVKADTQQSVPDMISHRHRHRLPWRDALPSGVLEMEALCRHRATVLTVSGCVDDTNIEGLGIYVARHALIGNAVILDLSSVTAFDTQAMSVFYALDEACDAAEVPWMVVPSLVVDQALHVAGFYDALAMASSVPLAMRHLTRLARVRRHALSS